MTDQIAYQEYIQRRYNAFCKTVIRCAALDKILKLKRQWERQVSLDYLMNEKFVQFAASEPDEEYPFTVCGQTVLLCNAALADAISVLPEQTREEILRYSGVPFCILAPLFEGSQETSWQTGAKLGFRRQRTRWRLASASVGWTRVRPPSAVGPHATVRLPR